MYLNPCLEYECIKEWTSELVNKSNHTPRTILKKIKKNLNKYHPVRIKLYAGADFSLDPGDFTFGAEYDPDLDENDKKHFIINFIINHPNNSEWNVTQEIADRMTLELTEILVHEYEHQEQWRARKYKLSKKKYTSDHEQLETKEQQEYLGHPDEMQAYSANIAARYYLLIHKLGTHRGLRSLDLLKYFEAFGKDHKITKTVIKMIKANIKELKKANPTLAKT